MVATGNEIRQDFGLCSSQPLQIEQGIEVFVCQQQRRREVSQCIAIQIKSLLLGGLPILIAEFCLRIALQDDDVRRQFSTVGSMGTIC